MKAKLGIKRVRGDTFGYLQRSFVGCVSKVDQREAREVGEKAVQYALGGAGDGSVAIRRVGDYAVDYPLVPLETVAGKTRVMEDSLINAAGNDVTPAFHDYLRPLLGADVIEVARLRGAKVAKAGVLTGDFDLSREAIRPGPQARGQKEPPEANSRFRPLRPSSPAWPGNCGMAQQLRRPRKGAQLRPALVLQR